MQVKSSGPEQVRFRDSDGDAVFFDRETDGRVVVTTKMLDPDSSAYGVAELDVDDVAALLAHLGAPLAYGHACAECGTTEATTYVVTQLDPDDINTETEVCRACDDELRGNEVVERVIALWNGDPRGGWIPGAAYGDLAIALGIDPDRLSHYNSETRTHHIAKEA